MAWRTITRCIGVAALVVAWGASVPAAAAGDGRSFYEASVPLTREGEAAAFRAGLADVLVKVTGRRDASTLPGMAALVDDAARYVSSYRRAPGGLLAITYDGEGIERALEASGLPFWGPERPVTLVWLALDPGPARQALVTAESTSREKQALEAVARQRGVPLVFPAAANGEDARLRLEQAWSGDVASLAAAASRYGADGVLVGRARATAAGGGYSVDWVYDGPGGRSGLRGDLVDGAHLAADRLASLYASSEAGRRSDLDVTVTGIVTAADYADVSRTLAGLAAVGDVRLVRVMPDSAVFRVTTRGGLRALQREAGAQGRLRPVAGEAGAAVFSYQR